MFVPKIRSIEPPAPMPFFEVVDFRRVPGAAGQVRHKCHQRCLLFLNTASGWEISAIACSVLARQRPRHPRDGPPQNRSPSVGRRADMSVTAKHASFRDGRLQQLA